MRISSDFTESTEKPAVVVDEKSIGEEFSLGEHGVKESYRDVFSNVKESALVRKIDLRVMPFIFILNVFTFLDR